jgi:hypothetical protein
VMVSPIANEHATFSDAAISTMGRVLLAIGRNTVANILKNLLKKYKKGSSVVS